MRMLKSILSLIMVSSVVGCGLNNLSEITAQSNNRTKLFEVRASSPALSGLVENVSQNTPINENKNGARFNGSANTQAKITVSPIPSADQMMLLFYVDMSSAAHYAISGSVPVWGMEHVANGTTKSTGVISSQISLNNNGFDYTYPELIPGVTSSTFQTVYQGIFAFAQNKVNAETRRRLNENEKVINSQFEEQIIAASMTAIQTKMAQFKVQANQLFQSSYGFLFNQHKVGFESSFQSSEKYASWALVSKSNNNVKPIADRDADLALRMHDSLLNQFVRDNIITDQFVTYDYFQQFFAGTPLPLVNLNTTNSNNSYPQFKFDSKKPLVFAFKDNQILVHSLAQVILSAGANPISYVLEVGYRIQPEAQNIRLIRNLLSATPANSSGKKIVENKPKREPGVASITGFFSDVSDNLINMEDRDSLEAMMATLFAQEVAAPISIPLYEGQANSLVLDSFGANDGWLFMNWLAR